MTLLDIAHAYFDAWNRHDPDGIVAVFAAGGTYSDPSTGGRLTGAAIAGYARELLTAFPDLTFEIVSVAPAGEGMVAAQWLMHGHNMGSLAGTPPTGRTLALPGADFIRIAGDMIESVEGYFDQRTLAEQLGLQVLVLPYSAGLVSFGPGCYVQSPTATRPPGALSLTSIQARSAAEVKEFWDQSQQIMGELSQTPGFISNLTVCIGQRGFTITTWEDEESPRQMMRGGTHRHAVKKFFNHDFTAGAMTSVWVPQRTHTMWVRCEFCGRLVDANAPNGKCKCGEPLPELPPYW